MYKRCGLIAVTTDGERRCGDERTLDVDAGSFSGLNLNKKSRAFTRNFEISTQVCDFPVDTPV